MTTPGRTQRLHRFQLYAIAFALVLSVLSALFLRHGDWILVAILAVGFAAALYREIT